MEHEARKSRSRAPNDGARNYLNFFSNISITYYICVVIPTNRSSGAVGDPTGEPGSIGAALGEVPHERAAAQMA